MIDRESELNEQGRARRRFLKQAATVAWASPFIVTMMSRTAHAQPIVCGTQDASGCNLTGLPCGTAGACVPDPGNPGIGNDCICLP